MIRFIYINYLIFNVLVEYPFLVIYNWGYT